jgi:hypothetical protein
MKVSTLRYLWTQGDGSVVHFTEHKGTVLLCTLLAGKPGGIWMEKFSLVALDSSFCLFPMSCASFCSAKLTEEFEFSNQFSRVPSFLSLWTQGDGSIVHFSGLEHKGTVLLCTFLVEKYWGICLWEHKGTVLLCTFLAAKYWGICLEK